MDSENIKETPEFEPSLGMIIQIVAPQDERFHKKLFLIDYLDNDLMKIIDETYTTYNLNIIQGELSEKSIQYIITVKQPTEVGYARQNGMTVGTWWTIEYAPPDGKGMPAIYNGEITNLDEDQIEFSVFDNDKEEKDIIYIDFEYKGIPLDLPIKFYKLSKPNIVKNVSAIDQLIDPTDDDIENIDFDEPVIDSETIKEQQKEYIIEADNIEFRILDETIEETIEKDETEKVYDITDQTNDLLNSLLSNVKSNERTPKKLSKINLVINRYKELRQNFSNFDPLGNSESPKKFTHEYRPIVEQLKTLSKNINWVVPVVKDRHNVFFDKLDDNVDVTDVDIIPKDNRSSFQEDYELQQAYLKRNIPDGVNKYDYLTNSTFKPNFTIPDNNKDIVSKIDGNNSQRANVNIFSYVANVNDLESTTIDENGKVQKSSWNTNVYNEPLYRLNHIQKDLTERNVVMKKGQVVPILGFLVFPLSFKDYSQAHFLPTNILKKSNLNLTPLRHFEFLQNNKIIDVIDVPKTYTDSPILQKSKENFLKNMKLFFYQQDLSYEDRDKTENMDTFLKQIFPKIKDLIESLSFDGCVSYERVLHELQPFFIEYKHITFKQYQKLNEIIEQEILNYRKKNASLIRNCNNYLQNLPESYLSQSELLDIIPDLDDDFDPTKDYSAEQQQQEILDKSVKDAYDILKTDQPSEYFRKSLTVDDSRYLYNACVFSQLNVQNDVNIDDVIKELNEKIQNTDLNISVNNSDDCAPKVLSKRYANIEDLMDEAPIAYFDKQFDDTRYDIYKELNHINSISDKQQQKKMLINHLITEIDVPEEDAVEQAASMIEGKKLIKEGHYAVMDDGSGDNRYYFRKEGNWIMDESLSGLSVEEISFCNLKTNCIKINDKCTNINKTREEAQLDLMKEMLDKVENELVKNTEEIKENIKSTLKKNLRNIIIFKDYINKQNKKYDVFKYDIAMLYNSLDIARSPNIDLRDQVLATEDIVLRYDRIIKFKEKHCREANLDNGDDPNWFYCNVSIDQSIKLLPTFMYELATTFNTNIDLYVYTLEQIKKERGKISDDGDKMVDKYSGYEICKIEYSTDEGYEESGAKKISRGLLDTSSQKKLEEQRKKLIENKIDNQEVEDDEKQDKKEENTNVFVSHLNRVIPALDRHLGIDTKSQHQFIENYVLELMDKKMKSAKKYKEDLENDPNLISYRNYQGEFFLYSMLGMYAIAIQTHMPHISRGRGFSKCVESYKGFPLEKGDDFLHYLICVCIILRGPNKKAEFPFILLPKYKEKKKLDNELKHVKFLKSHMKKTILSIPAIKDKLEMKRKFLMDNLDQVEKEMVYDYRQWSTFLPPLVNFNMDKLVEPNKDFETLLTKSLNDKRLEENVKYTTKLLTSIRSFSLSIQEDIQRVIDSRPSDSLFLKSQDGSTIFLENACCNETNDSPYNYFIEHEKSPDIKKHNETVIRLSNIYENYRKLLNVSLLYSPENTRLEKLSISDEFTENSIYLAFIKYCKINTQTILPEELQELCHSNVSKFKKLDSLEQKIDVLKQEGHKYNRTSLKVLLNIIARSNGLKKIEPNNLISPKVTFEKIIDEFKDHFGVANIHGELFALLDRYDVGYTEKSDIVVVELISKIEKETDILLGSLNKLLDIKRKSKKSKEIMKNLINLREIPLDDVKKGESRYISKEDENAHFLYRFLLMISKNIANDYPVSLQKKDKNAKMTCPERWDFSRAHTRALENSVFKELEKLNQFIGDKELKEILRAVIEENKNLIIVFENLPFYSRLNKEIKTIFDGTIIHKLSYYLFLCILNSYNMILEKKFEDISGLNRIESGKALGKKAYLQNKITDLIMVYLDIAQSYKQNLFLNRFQIMEKTKKEQEYERAEITGKYATLTDDEKDVEIEMQKNKLGSWSSGASKAIYEYDAEYTEQQIANLEKRTLLEYMAGKEDNVSMDRVQALDLQEKVDEIIREREAQRLVDEEYNTNLVFGEDEDHDDLEQFDYGMNY
jgi:hypothetical protein